MADAHQTLPQMILDRARTSPRCVAFRVRRDEAYVDVPWSELSPRIEAIAAGLLSAGALDDGACISIVGNTSMASCLVDFAALRAGLKTVPVYASLLPEEVGYMHVDTQAQLIVVDDGSQLEKVRTFREGFTFFEQRYTSAALGVRAKVVVIHPAGLAPAEDWESLESLESRGRERRAALAEELRRRASLIRREDVATFTYTSGTTGAPKAVIQTHDNMLAMLEDVAEAGLLDDNVRGNGLFLFLPAAHSFGRMVEFAGPFFGAPLVMSSVPTLAADVLLARPGFFPAAPRVFEKMMAKVMSAIESEQGLRRWMLDWALGVGREVASRSAAGTPLPVWLKARHRLADRLVLGKLRARLGLDNASVLLSGAAALRVDVQMFFLGLGLTILEAYGLTETCPGLTVNRKGNVRPGSVGRPFNRCELKLGPDGELLARGPNISRGYLNRPEATAEAFDEDGWFRTGDLASIDAEGFVRIAGRKKELLKTSGGKYVAPLKIEAQLKRHPLVQEAVVIGDGRNYCTALFALDAEILVEVARREGIPPDPAHPRIHTVLETLVTETNAGLATFERIKTFRVSPGPFTVDGGELTASLKVKRHAVARKHAALIDSMYGASESLTSAGA
ncbi:long-chain fatty acid--CoA ligase [Comamonas sp. JC664]|uniref:AMP-dependent synthetase/ligase n=1 Tax=Comamonas sp. JC664 TaxID=2801917 RepID=UPI00174B2ADA|nr:long-chain fatty acid--CoA ligase [Comamonas sp. JC664]MBL0698046.1 long-chain fatty acid--CoA ligase [Comamonas sp. JC664]GHG71019.1 AMP-dependent synthetase [Comamonas sp. KCTC 72670]